MIMKTLIDAVPSLKKLAGQELRMSTLHDVAKMIDKFESELRFYDEKRSAIIEKYCIEENGVIKPRENEADNLESAMKELLELEIDINGINLPVVIPEEENLLLSYADLCALNDFIKIKWANS